MQIVAITRTLEQLVNGLKAEWQHELFSKKWNSSVSSNLCQESIA